MHAADRTDPAATDGVPPATLVGLVVALLALPLLAATTRWLSVSLSPIASLTLRWLVLLAILGVVLWWEDRPLRSVGVRRPELADVGYLLVAALLGFLALAATGPLVDALGLSQADQGGLGVAETGVGIAVATAITVGIVEEVCYRGYAIERLLEYPGGPVVAGGLSWLVFTLAHAPSWHAGDLLQISLAALVFTLVYLRRRSLVPVVGAHVLIWLVGVLGAIYG